ncbi:hypothetical protein LIH_08510 [Leptospira interrogans serovar Hardjo-prajitno]|nr:hypothetical protein LIH_08510 [Leptospira interrogans serovar Hardjo-prajitno]
MRSTSLHIYFFRDNKLLSNGIYYIEYI